MIMVKYPRHKNSPETEEEDQRRKKLARERNYRYRQKHPEKFKAYLESYSLKNKEIIKEKRKITRDALPPITYRFEDSNGIVFYVGSGSIQRAKQHKTISSWWTSELSFIFIEQPSIAHARRDEYQWIIDLLPLYNKDGKKGLT